MMHQLGSARLLPLVSQCTGVSGCIIPSILVTGLLQNHAKQSLTEGQNSYGASSGGLEQQELSYYCASNSSPPAKLQGRF